MVGGDNMGLHNNGEAHGEAHGEADGVAIRAKQW